MKTDKLLKLIQQKKAMRSGGALSLPKHQGDDSQVGETLPVDPFTGLPIKTLRSVTVEGERPDTYANYMANKYKDVSLLGAMFGMPLDAVLGFPQAALTKAFTGKYQLPSEAMGIENPVGAVATDVLLDPTNLVGLGALTKEQVLARLANPRSKTSYSILRNPEGKVQFLDNETYRNAIVAGKQNVIDYLSDPRYQAVVERNQQIANRVGLNKNLPIQREMNQPSLYEARLTKIKEPLDLNDPRSLELDIINNNSNVGAQYTRTLGGKGSITVPRVYAPEKITGSTEHEILHHIYPNLGEGYPSFTPLETAKAKSVFKPSAELRKIEEANNVPLWYLDDVDELVPNSFDLARGMGIKKFEKYPGIDAFKKMLESYSGSKSFVKDALKLDTPRDYKRAWDMLSGVRLGVVPATIGVGALQQIDEKQIGGLTMNSYQKGGGIKDMVVSEIWEKVTGTKWSQAKKLGLTDGSFDKNLALRKRLLEEYKKPRPDFGKFIAKPGLPAPSPVATALRKQAMAEAAMPASSRPPVYMEPVVGKPATAKPGKKEPVPAKSAAINQMINEAARQVAIPNTTGVAAPVIVPVAGISSSGKVRSIPAVDRVNAPVAAVDASRVAMPAMSPVVGPAPIVPTSGSELPVATQSGPGTLESLAMSAPALVNIGLKEAYGRTLKPTVNYLTDPKSKIAANMWRSMTGLGVPLNVANMTGDLVGAGLGMDDLSLTDEQKKILYEAALNAQKRKSPYIQYEDYAGLGYGDDNLFVRDLKFGKIPTERMIKESFTNPAYNVASTIGSSVYEFAPDGTLRIRGSSDWNPEDPNFKNPKTLYQKVRNFMRSFDRERLKNMTPEEMEELKRKNEISMDIPKSILNYNQLPPTLTRESRKVGGATAFKKIRIRKNG